MKKPERLSGSDQDNNFLARTGDSGGEDAKNQNPYQTAGKRVHELICQLQQAGQWPQTIGETEEETETLARQSWTLINQLWRDTCEALNLPWPPVQR
jgi:hypothetical protein